MARQHRGHLRQRGHAVGRIKGITDGGRADFQPPLLSTTAPKG
jgi:hypothetical protein